MLLAYQYPSTHMTGNQLLQVIDANIDLLNASESPVDTLDALMKTAA